MEKIILTICAIITENAWKIISITFFVGMAIQYLKTPIGCYIAQKSPAKSHTTIQNETEIVTSWTPINRNRDRFNNVQRIPNPNEQNTTPQTSPKRIQHNIPDSFFRDLAQNYRRIREQRETPNASSWTLSVNLEHQRLINEQILQTSQGRLSPQEYQHIKDVITKPDFKAEFWNQEYHAPLKKPQPNKSRYDIIKGT